MGATAVKELANNELSMRCGSSSQGVLIKEVGLHWLFWILTTS